MSALRKLATGNNYFRWDAAKIAIVKDGLGSRLTPLQIAAEVGAHDEQCIFYAMRKFNLTRKYRNKVGGRRGVV